MKRIILFLVVFINVLCIHSQSIFINPEGDTLVVLSSKDVYIINRAFIDLRYTKEELVISDSIISRKDRIISYKDSILSLKDDQISTYRDLLGTELKRSKRARRRAGFIGVISGIVIGFLSGILIK